MKQDKNNFTHESLQDSESIVNILASVSDGLSKGKLIFTDEDNTIVMKPEGLLQLKLTASQDENNHRLNIKVSWQTANKKIKKKSLSIKTK